MTLKASIVKYFNDNGHEAVARHGSVFSRIGDPDIDVWLHFNEGQKIAIPIRIEVKRDMHDLPRKAQILRMRRSEQRGITCYVVWNMEQVQAIESHWEDFVTNQLSEDYAHSYS